ncbi:MAG: M20/M25/M40 family metallo-hydrolase [Planctomycetota bacterium]|jgi:glutamate carboxypeptidase
MNAFEHLRRMVAINSFTQNRDGVNELGDYCEELFTPLGFSVERVGSVMPDCGDHLFFEREGEIPLVLVAHLDTVYPPDQAFDWRENGNKVHGPGVADIKGGIVVMWDALRRLGDLDRFHLRLFLNATEEGGCSDFPVLSRERVMENTRACLVFEPGFDLGHASSVVVARKGSGRFRIQVEGRESHSGNEHHRGASAIRELARLTETIESWTDYDRDVTWSVGTFHGGTAVNCVPADATAGIDLRIWTPEEFEAGRKRILALSGDGSVVAHDGRARCTVEVSELPGYPPWPDNPASRELADRIVRIGASLGQAIEPTQRRGGSDGALLWDLAPTVDGLGPVGRDTHCAIDDPETGREQESIDVDSLEQRALLAAKIMESFA